MRTKRKISVTIDEEIFKAIEEASNNYNMTKSQLAQEAFSLWIKKKTGELMAMGYIEMSNEDREFSDISFEAQKEIVS